MTSNLKQIVNHLLESVPEYTTTATHKIITATGGASAVYNVRDWLPEWASSSIDSLASFPWMSTLSAIALILLIVERCFIVWAWYRRIKRNDYSDKKPQE
jgi:hypothetical protein